MSLEEGVKTGMLWVNDDPDAGPRRDDVAADEGLGGEQPGCSIFDGHRPPEPEGGSAVGFHGPQRDYRLPQPGTLLIRRFKGREILVKVLDQGFEYESRHYRSLSAIAREATGARWNGVLFFGLTERRHG